MKSFTNLMAAAAVIALMSPAMAQDYQSPPAASPAAPALPNLAPVLPNAAMPTAPDAMAPVVAPALDLAGTHNSKFIEQQGALQTLASSWIGSSVSNSSDESLANINDVVFDENHQIVAIVVGVGGLLGMGEKNVGISISAVKASADADGKVKFVIDVSADELNNAPAFTTLAHSNGQAMQSRPSTAATASVAIPSSPIVPTN